VAVARGKGIQTIMRSFVAALFAALLFLPLGAARADTYPSRPIRFVIPFGPGSASDALARIAGQELAASLGQPVVVVHKPGADGALAGIEVQRSPPDGYTFLFGTNSPLAVVPTSRKNPPYNVLTDFTPVTFLGDNTFFLAIHPAVPVNSVAELVTYARANPGRLNHAAGNTYAMVSMALFAANNDVDIQAVPYKSEPDAIIDVLSGRIQLLHGTATTVAAHVRDGKLKVLATNLAERSPLMPDVPTIVEAGQPPFPVGPWFALVGPAGLPADIVARMNQAMAAALTRPSVREPMQKQGFMPRSSTPEELAAFLKSQLTVWQAALKVAGIEQQ
jgi:tripartite-type tricarboxylate transporter receptor subunit TctC